MHISALNDCALPNAYMCTRVYKHTLTLFYKLLMGMGEGVEEG